MVDTIILAYGRKNKRRLDAGFAKLRSIPELKKTISLAVINVINQASSLGEDVYAETAAVIIFQSGTISNSARLG
jgi:hypothetical protein